jgi:hypothetical protein
MRTVLAAASTALLLAACGQGDAPSQNVASSGDQADTVTQPDTSTPAASTPPAPFPTTDTTPSPGEQGGTDDWRQVVTAADASSLSRLDQAWRMARAEADDKGFADDVTALGPLVDPNAGQAGRLQPAPGTYRCRTVKMGTKTEVGLAFNAYPFFQCSVELTPGGDLILTKTTGSQRTRGLLYPDTDRRLVFVGAQAWGMDETGFPRYGQQPVRDQVGVFERIGPNRWRLAIPWPRVESKLEILELVR